mgnify:CR=1 FL=1
MRLMNRGQSYIVWLASWLFLSGCASLPETKVLEFVPSEETYLSQRQIGFHRRKTHSCIRPTPANIEGEYYYKCRNPFLRNNRAPVQVTDADFPR